MISIMLWVLVQFHAGRDLILWPTFHGPMILPCVSDSIRYEGIILWILVQSDTIIRIKRSKGYLYVRWNVRKLRHNLKSETDIFDYIISFTDKNPSIGVCSTRCEWGTLYGRSLGAPIKPHKSVNITCVHLLHLCRPHTEKIHIVLLQELLYYPCPMRSCVVILQHYVVLLNKRQAVVLHWCSVGLSEFR